ncbi:hypothetical protein PG988_005622 [Apiospora saccharicola]
MNRLAGSGPGMAMPCRPLSLGAAMQYPRPAFEYADPDHNPDAEGHGTQVSSKYIECRNGETFTIHVRVNKTHDHQQPVPHTLNHAVCIDGHRIGRELCRESHLRDGPLRVDIKERFARATEKTVSNKRGLLKKKFGLKPADTNNGAADISTPGAASTPAKTLKSKKSTGTKRKDGGEYGNKIR